MRDQNIRRYPRTLRISTRAEIPIERKPKPPRRILVSSLPLLLLGGFLVAIMAGTLLLMLPIASESRQWTAPITALFVSTSAVTVTGLSPVDTADYWSGFGEAVILVLVQIGGLGFMTSATLLFLIFGWRVGLRERINLSQSMDLSRMGGVVSLTRRAIYFTLAVEAIGFVVLSARAAFDLPLGQALWTGLFHSVSAFNNAGFDLMGSFRGFEATADAVTLLTVLVLAVVGSLGFLVIEDLRYRKHRVRRFNANTTIVLWTTGLLLVGGALVFLLLEWSHGLQGESLPQKLLHAIFVSGSYRTAGFSALPVSELYDETQFFIISLMFIGGASGSTAGGIKVATLAVILAAAIAAVRGREHAELADREVPRSDVDRALAVVLLAGLLVFVVAILMGRLHEAVFLPLLFESVSAFGTNGLTTGVTPELSDPSLVLLSITMFIGRLGPLTLVLALVQRAGPQMRRLPEERVRIG